MAQTKDTTTTNLSLTLNYYPPVVKPGNELKISLTFAENFDPRAVLMVDLLSEQGERVISQTFKYPEKELSLSLGENLAEARYILQISHKNLPIYTTYLDVIENQDYVYKKTRFVDGLKKKESVYEAFEGRRYEEAICLHEEVAQAYQDAGNFELAARSWEDLAEEFYRVNQPDFALQALEEAKKILQGLGNHMEAVETVEEKIGICRVKLEPLEHSVMYQMLVNYLNSVRSEDCQYSVTDNKAVKPFTPKTANLLCERSSGVPRWLNRLGSYVLQKASELNAETITPEILEEGLIYANQQVRGQLGLTPADFMLIDLILEKGSLSDENITLEDLEKLNVQAFSELIPIFNKLEQLDLTRRLPNEQIIEFAPTPLLSKWS
jgi:tetratricopeptide (TPR) repeat protein